MGDGRGQAVSEERHRSTDPLPPNNAGQTAMIAAEIDMCVYSGSLRASARLQGADVVMVVSFLNKPLYRLVVRPEIKTVADLKGRRLGITRFGTVTDSMTRLLIGKLGLDPEKDVSYVSSG